MPIHTLNGRPHIRATHVYRSGNKRHRGADVVRMMRRCTDVSQKGRVLSFELLLMYLPTTLVMMRAETSTSFMNAAILTEWRHRQVVNISTGFATPTGSNNIDGLL